MDQSHNVKPLPELKPGQQVLFLSPAEQNQYFKGTVTTKATTPRNYYLEIQDKTYYHTFQHICTINADTPITRPIPSQDIEPEKKHNKQQQNQPSAMSLPHYKTHSTTNIIQ